MVVVVQRVSRFLDWDGKAKASGEGRGARGEGRKVKGERQKAKGKRQKASSARRAYAIIRRRDGLSAVKNVTAQRPDN
jgi:hypothetical protein